jgi:hypothetical protein
MVRRKPIDFEKVELQIADAYELPVFPILFNGCMAVDWFAYVPGSRFADFLNGLHTRLTPDAIVVFCDQTPGLHSLTKLRDDEGNHLQERFLSDGTQYRVIKHFSSDEEYCTVFSPYSKDIRIVRFAECCRVVVRYKLNGE